MEIEIRAFVEDDMELYLEGEIDSFRLTYPGLTIGAELEKELKENVLHSFAHRTSEGFTAITSNPIGFIILSTQYIFNIPVGYVENIYVKEEERSKGYGRKLLIFAQDYFREKGYRVLQLDVTVHHRSALRLYETEGFQVGGYRMEKNIAL